MSNDDLEADDGAWGPPVAEAAFEDLAAAPRAIESATLELPIDVAVLVDVLAALDDRVPYKLGGKPSSLKLTTEQFLAERGTRGVDCSGFVRWLLYRSSAGRVKLPDGSVNQRDRLRALADEAGVATTPYATCGQVDNVLRIAGFTRSAKVAVGHIWLVLNGETGESRGHHGVDRRRWDTPALVELATWCYPLAALEPAG